jgi:hypothetical protein
MGDLTQFSILVALIALSAGFYGFLFNRLERRIDRLEDRFAGMDGKFDALRRDLAEEFRAQRAEVAAQVAAIANAINASRP